MHHVVVIGGGFAGLMALKQLAWSKKLKLTLVSTNDYFLFTPRLTELLNGSVSRKIVVKNIKSIFGRRVDFIKDKAIFIDFNKKYVETKNEKKISYDYLIMSQGATTNFYGIKNCESCSIDFKNMEAIPKIKAGIRNSLLEYSKSGKKELLTFAVVGAGLTGIELICSLREAVLREIKKISSIDTKEAIFMLIESSKTIAPQLNANTRKKIEKHLRKKGIRIITNNRVSSIERGNVNIKDGRIEASTIIWTAGIKANIIETDPKIKLANNNQIKATEKLKIPNHDGAYVAGDAALVIGENVAIAPTAQAAWQEGVCIGKNILRRIEGKKEKNFRYYHKGTLIVLGSKSGIFTYKWIAFDGKFAWHFRDLFYRYRFWQIT